MTAGEFGCGTLIDHVAASFDLTAASIEAWSNVIDGRRLTDHSRVVVTLERRPTIARSLLDSTDQPE
ncbi:MAG: hypothetical protein ABJH68_05815 [Ilumatobacter sp.]|uniref:hypothetical protein n=1 Tax=Ilumatobacter sp. TaxID=1967498 RepID=UPI00329A357E